MLILPRSAAAWSQDVITSYCPAPMVNWRRRRKRVNKQIQILVDKRMHSICRKSHTIWWLHLMWSLGRTRLPQPTIVSIQLDEEFGTATVSQCDSSVRLSSVINAFSTPTTTMTGGLKTFYCNGIWGIFGPFANRRVEAIPGGEIKKAEKCNTNIKSHHLSSKTSTTRCLRRSRNQA